MRRHRGVTLLAIASFALSGVIVVLIDHEWTPFQLFRHCG
jgi:hypothetical protein